ncbi:hypothetical protein O181_022646 [Austropuccinia psidii MF-1]|uniref:Reverse transcriptase Ty1/copia-type domain-containing protein n=1 Tax=Austropuccinia psidii MF-1 TaxID=1389203 RepID=A0A9Q3CHV3_9BASI|nr:hypothetical protein [Austropuccinia psidii MF-1]
MTKHQVWTPSNHPSNLNPLTNTWVFKKKTNENGNITKFKAQLCVRGFSQTEGIDYDEVFAPTGRLASLRLLLTLCSLNKLEVHQMDKQRVIALSSTEAEYNALSSCCQDSEWLCQLFSEITFKKITSTIYSNNQSSIALASNRIYHHGTRHIDFRLHFVWSLIEDEKIILKYIPTQYMVADLLTKNLPYLKSKGHIEIIFGLEGQHKLQGTEG